jgi:hypothetical protein
MSMSMSMSNRQLWLLKQNKILYNKGASGASETLCAKVYLLDTTVLLADEANNRTAWLGVRVNWTCARDTRTHRGTRGPIHIEIRKKRD